MNQNKDETSVPASARRRLLRGAFAAPTVLTLYSGGALAAKSQALRCVVNQNNNPVSPVPAVSATSSTYIRVQLYAVSSVYYVRGQDLPVARITSLPSNSQSQVFNIFSNTLTGSPLSTPSGLLAQPQWAVMRVNSAGTVVGVGTSGTGGSAIWQSCWNSAFINPN